MVTHTYNISIQQRQEDCLKFELCRKFLARLGSRIRLRLEEKTKSNFFFLSAQEEEVIRGLTQGRAGQGFSLAAEGPCDILAEV